MPAIAAARQQNLETSRDKMILDHYPLVRTIACRMVRRFPSNVDVEELINVGVMGLIDAVDRFDPSRKVPFKAYAEIRIRGAIVDALRESDWVPRSVRRKYNRIELARTELRRQLGRSPSREEIAEVLGLSIDEYELMAEDARLRKLVSLDAPVDDENPTALCERISSHDEDVTQIFQREELRAEVLKAVRHLPKKERTAVSLYYLHDLILKEIGEVLGVTESRASQLCSQGVKRLRFRLSRYL